MSAFEGSVTHQVPPVGSGVMPCCGRTPFEVPIRDRLTADRTAVTCQRALLQDQARRAEDVGFGLVVGEEA